MLLQRLNKVVSSQPCLMVGRYFVQRSFRSGQKRLLSSNRPTPSKTENLSTLKLAILGTTLGATGGTIYSLYNNWTDTNSHKEHEHRPPVVVKTFPNDVQITKRYINANDNSGLDITLFQFQTCPFCCKVRAFLDFNGISYNVVEVDAVLRQDIRWSSQKKVPMVLIRQSDGSYVQMSDSSAIISLIATYINDKKMDIGELAKFYPSISFFDNNQKKREDIMNKYFLMYREQMPKGYSKEMEECERNWRTWTDSHLVHLISPNCYQTLGEAFATFEWFSQAGEWDVHFPRWERNLMVYMGATAMWLISKILKKRHHLSDDVRSHIYEACSKWTNELEKRKTPFMGGKNPNLADLSVYGVLCSMEGCQAFKDCVDNTRIGNWFYSLKQIVEQNRGKLVRERIAGHHVFETEPANV